MTDTCLMESEEDRHTGGSHWLFPGWRLRSNQEHIAHSSILLCGSYSPITITNTLTESSVRMTSCFDHTTFMQFIHAHTFIRFTLRRYHVHDLNASYCEFDGMKSLKHSNIKVEICVFASSRSIGVNVFSYCS